ncbi:MAG TPA: hypothetical protein VKV28_11740 [Candidatus Binataceae bacterium]|nr:hypothetical protein [Candidatus Binataceae bacterium]
MKIAARQRNRRNARLGRKRRSSPQQVKARQRRLRRNRTRA